MKLYLAPLSPNVRRVRLAAAALSLQLDEVLVDFSKGEHKAPDYLKLNPNGSVPTLVDGDFVLTESRAIMQYLAAQRPDSGLAGRDSQAQAQVMRWQFWDAAHFSPQLGTITFEKVIKPMLRLGEPRQDKIDEALTNFRRFGAVLDARLQGREYVASSALTIADLTLASSLMYANQTDVPLSDFPHIQRWFSRISALEAWRQTDPF